MSDYRDSSYASLFGHNAMKMLSAYMNTYNQESQALAVTGVDPATTGTKKMVGRSRKRISGQEACPHSKEEKGRNEPSAKQPA